MKIIFISNYLNHHQKPFCDEMYKILGDDYKFIATSKIAEERLKLGYKAIEEESYLICANEDNKNYCIKIISDADAVIIGSAPDFYIKNRIKENKIIFRYSERPLKKGVELLKYIPRFIKWHYKNPIFKKIYLLCASAYTYYDYSRFCLFKNKAFKWGYFTEVKKYNDINKLIQKKKKNSILWVGRLIQLKHPEYALKVAKKLKEEGYTFEMNIIGDGPMLNDLKKTIKKDKLEKCVFLHGSVPSSDVRKFMEDNQIFIFTSNKMEGWGAVLNEAMNSACAAVASNVIGAVPFLLNKKNGLIFKSGNVDDLYIKTKFLLDNQKQRIEIGINAYKTMENLWNPKIAAERLIKLTDKMINNMDYNIFSEGPCSKSKIMKDYEILDDNGSFEEVKK